MRIRDLVNGKSLVIKMGMKSKRLKLSQKVWLSIANGKNLFNYNLKTSSMFGSRKGLMMKTSSTRQRRKLKSSLNISFSTIIYLTILVSIRNVTTTIHL